MTLRRLLVSALHLCYIANVGHSFNIDMDFPILLQGPRNGNLNKHFGHSLQSYEKVCCIKSNKINLIYFKTCPEWSNKNYCGRSTKC